MSNVKFSKSYQHFGETRVDVFIDTPVSSDKAMTEIFLQRSSCSGLWEICREGVFRVNPKDLGDEDGIVWGYQILAGEFPKGIFPLKEAKRRVAEMDLTYRPGSQIRARGMDLVSREYLGKEALDYE